MKQSNLIKLYERSFQKYEISSNIIISVRFIHLRFHLGSFKSKKQSLFFLRSQFN